MSMIYYVFSVLFFLTSIALVVIILMQKKRSKGVSALGGGSGSQTYWDKNKGNSIEGTLERYTKILGVLFIVLAIIIGFIN